MDSTAAVQLRAAAAHLLDVTNRPFMQARLVADRISTRWGTAEEMSLTAAFYPDASTPFNALLNFDRRKRGREMEFTAGGRVGPRRRASHGRGRRRSRRPTSNRRRLKDVALSQGDSRWGSASISLTLKAAQLDDIGADKHELGSSGRGSRPTLSCHLDATNLQTPQLRFETLATGRDVAGAATGTSRTSKADLYRRRIERRRGTGYRFAPVACQCRGGFRSPWDFATIDTFRATLDSPNFVGKAAVASMR